MLEWLISIEAILSDLAPVKPFVRFGADFTGFLSRGRVIRTCGKARCGRPRCAQGQTLKHLLPAWNLCHRWDLPQVHAEATGVFFAGEDFGFQQSEDLRLEGGVSPDPLQARQDRRQLVAALERQLNLFNGNNLEVRLG